MNKIGQQIVPVRWGCKSLKFHKRLCREKGKNMFRKIFCHHVFVFHHHTSGDENNQFPSRTVVKCDKCGMLADSAGKTIYNVVGSVDAAGGHSHKKYEVVNV